MHIGQTELRTPVKALVHTLGNLNISFTLENSLLAFVEKSALSKRALWRHWFEAKFGPCVTSGVQRL